jgi:hypothetical protein
MGRWAEVYFTNPPEKRGQAVSDLLRELEKSSAAASPAVPGSTDKNGERKRETADSPNLFPSPLEPGRTCGACAYDNSAGQRFCGMCGAPLQISPQTKPSQAAETVTLAGASWWEGSLGRNRAADAIESAIGATPADEDGAAWELSSWLPEKNLPHARVKFQRLFYRYRLYVGAGLAILLATLSYRVWRGTEGRSDAAASPSTTAIPHAQPAPAHSARSTSAAHSAMSISALPASEAQDQNQVDAKSRSDQRADSPIAPRTVPAAASSVAAAPSGAEELALAEKYLNGAPGTTRDSGEAAQWLWKAVRKRNLEAALALSDLYLQGDGVSKSCDQARLLLDAAARKGSSAAAERLRNLQAAGCP